MKKATKLLTAIATAAALILGAGAFVSCSNSSDSSSSAPSTEAQIKSAIAKFDAYGEKDDLIKGILGEAEGSKVSTEKKAVEEAYDNIAEMIEYYKNMPEDGGASKCKICNPKKEETDAQAEEGDDDNDDEGFCGCAWNCGKDECKSMYATKAECEAAFLKGLNESYKDLDDAIKALEDKVEEVNTPEEPEEPEEPEDGIEE